MSSPLFEYVLLVVSLCFIVSWRPTKEYRTRHSLNNFLLNVFVGASSVSVAAAFEYYESLDRTGIFFIVGEEAMSVSLR